MNILNFVLDAYRISKGKHAFSELQELMGKDPAQAERLLDDFVTVNKDMLATKFAVALGVEFWARLDKKKS